MHLSIIYLNWGVLVLRGNQLFLRIHPVLRLTHQGLRKKLNNIV